MLYILSVVNFDGSGRLCSVLNMYRGMVGRIYKEDRYALLHKNMKAMPCGFEEDILCFSPGTPGLG